MSTDWQESPHAEFGLGQDTIPLFRFPRDNEIAEAWFKTAPVGAEFIDITNGWERKKVSQKPQEPRRKAKRGKQVPKAKRRAKKRSGGR